MMRTSSKKLFIFTATILCSSQLLGSQFSSDIFSFDCPEFAKGCHTTLSGTSKQGVPWTVRDIQLNDIPYHAKAFADPTIMAGFATGQTRTKKATADRIAANWMPRFLNGSPHGGMTIFNTDTNERNERIGHIVAGGGEGPGVSEIAYTLMEESWDGEGNPTIWGKGVMSSVVRSIVREWAPEVRRLSGEDMPEAVREAFACFGDKKLPLAERRLQRLDATASPSNPGSWKVLQKNGFEAAKTKLSCNETIADFEGHDLDPKAFEEKLMMLYTAETFLKSPLEKGKRYQVIGINGELITISHHTSYDRMKLHYELPLN